MNTESYDINRMASLILHFVLGLGASTDDALRALRLTERMLRDACEQRAS
ncbi:hypothetical protein [Bordetella genomosp. 8]|nr:hypothetical protein [Bordetella genomosp. 8]